MRWRSSVLSPENRGIARISSTLSMTERTSVTCARMSTAFALDLLEDEGWCNLGVDRFEPRYRSAERPAHHHPLVGTRKARSLHLDRRSHLGPPRSLLDEDETPPL